MNIKDLTGLEMMNNLSAHGYEINFIDSNIIELVRRDSLPAFNSLFICEIEKMTNSSVSMYENMGKTLTFRFNKDQS
jgi:hypothetical protein